MIRSVKLGAAILALLLASASWAAFPDKPIRVVIGFPAGGPLDQHGRLLLERLGSAPAFTDLMAGQVQFMAESIPQAARGQIRPFWAARTSPSSWPLKCLSGLVRSASRGRGSIDEAGNQSAWALCKLQSKSHFLSQIFMKTL